MFDVESLFFSFDSLESLVELAFALELDSKNTSSFSNFSLNDVTVTSESVLEDNCLILSKFFSFDDMEILFNGLDSSLGLKSWLSLKFTSFLSTFESPSNCLEK